MALAKVSSFTKYLKYWPIIVVAIIIACVLIVHYQYPTPITVQLTDFANALKSLNFSRITIAFWALIGGLATAIGAAGTLAWLYTQTRKALGIAQSSFDQLKVESQSTLSNLYTQSTAQQQAIETKDAAIAKITAEKEAATAQAQQYASQVETQAQAIERHRIEAETLMKQNAANFQSAIPTNVQVTGPDGTKIIKVIEKVPI